MPLERLSQGVLAAEACGVEPEPEKSQSQFEADCFVVGLSSGATRCGGGASRGDRKNQSRGKAPLAVSCQTWRGEALRSLEDGRCRECRGSSTCSSLMVAPEPPRLRTDGTASFCGVTQPPPQRMGTPSQLSLPRTSPELEGERRYLQGESRRELAGVPQPGSQEDVRLSIVGNYVSRTGSRGRYDSIRPNIYA